MHTNKILTAVLSLGLLSGILSCKSGEAGADVKAFSSDNGNQPAVNGGSDNNAATTAEAAVSNKYRFAIRLQSGQKYYYTLHSSLETSLEINDKETKTSNESEIGLVYEVLKDSAGTFLVKVTYDKLKIVLRKTGKEEEVYDAAHVDESSDQMDKLLGMIRGNSIVVGLNGEGDVLSLSGNTEIMDKVMGPMASADLETKRRVQELVSKLTGQGFVEDNLKEGFKLFPASELTIGDTWTRVNMQPGDMKFAVNSTYTLASLEKGVAGVNVKGRVENTKNNTLNIMGQQVTSDLQGDQEGVFKADIRTGLLIYGKTTTSASGNIQVIGKTIPMKFTSKREVTGKKIS